jgi:aromatic ring hydroxylase
MTTAPYAPGYLGLNLPAGLGSERFLMTGDEFVASLHDGRNVVDEHGERIANVTMHPQLAQGIRTLAAYYDLQHDPAYRDVMTYDDPEIGGRVSSAWKVPRTRDDLRQRRKLIEVSTIQTMGTFGRPVDYGPLQVAGLLQIIDRLEGGNPEWGENVRRFAREGARHNLMNTDVLANLQDDRSIPVDQRPGRLRCVKETAEGLVLYGAKPCNTILVQGHLGTIFTLLVKGIDPDATIFGVVPANAPNVTFVLRESTVREGAPFNRPISRLIGEEADALMIFDEVFLPREQVFSFRNEQLTSTYHERGILPQWHIVVRMAIKAGIIAGTAQLVTEVLGTDTIPQVRDAISDMTAYARGIQAYVLAAEEEGYVQNGVFVPNQKYLLPGRLYAVENYPRILQSLRELSGQGLISRFTEEQFADERVGAFLEEFVPGTGTSAKEKNRLFNFAWELTSSEHAMRTALFENVNATPPAVMRAEIYGDDRGPWVRIVREFLGRAMGE